MATPSSSDPTPQHWSRRCRAAPGSQPTSTPVASRSGWKQSTPWKPTSRKPTRNSPAPMPPATSCSACSASPTSGSSTTCPTRCQSADQDALRGHVLSNGIDANGRLIAFVYPGDHPGPDGTAVFVDPALVDQSLNALLLAAGHAYPAFYATLPADLRTHLAEVSGGGPGRPAAGRAVAALDRRPQRRRHHRRPGCRRGAGHLAQTVPPHRALPGRRVSATSTASMPGCGPTRSTATTSCS